MVSMAVVSVVSIVSVVSTPCCPRGPHVVPTWSPLFPRHPCVVLVFPHCPHSPKKVPMWSPWLWSPWSPLSLWSPPHVVPVVPMSSPCHPCCPHIIPIAPRRSPCGLHGCGLRGLCCHHPMLSPWSPCRPCHPHVVPVSSLSSPRHLEGPHIISHPPDTHSTHPLPPGALGGPKSVKMQ